MLCIDCDRETETRCECCMLAACDDCRNLYRGDVLCSSCYDSYVAEDEAEEEDEEFGWEVDHYDDVVCETVTDD